MGTSKSFETPGGGHWTTPKRQLTDAVNGTVPLDARRFVRNAIRALNGLGMHPRVSGGAGADRRRSGGGSPGGGGGGQSRAGLAPVGGAVQGLGGFGAQLGAAGLDAALSSLGLVELRGRPAAEVITRVAEHLSRGADGKQAEVLEAALRDAIFDIAAAEGDGSYENLEASLQSFMDREGIEGLIEAFLSQYVFTAIWSYFQNHAKMKAEGEEGEALVSAVEAACRSMVAEGLKSIPQSQRLDRVDWFGKGGQELAERLVSQLQSELLGL
jgi:hypothetical protein